MEQVHIERLRTLYSMMAGIPARVVYMSFWRSEHARAGYATNRMGDKKLFEQSVQQLVHDVNNENHLCNTAACAIGWATAYPEFKEAGFHMDETGHPTFGNYNNWEAIGNFFGISENEASQLFAPTSWRENNQIPSKNQKDIFLMRLRILLVSQGIITEQRNEELIELEAIQAEKDKIATYVIGN